MQIKKGRGKMLLSLLISTFLSIIIFSYLFYWLTNSKLRLFKLIQNKIDTFNEKKKRKIKVFSFMLIVLIAFFLPLLNLSDIIAGLIIGILISFRDICFKNTFIETFKNE